MSELDRTWKARLVSFCTPSNCRRAFGAALLAAALVGCYLWRFMMYALGHPDAAYWHQRRELYSWSLPIAKGFGQANKLIFALILFPISRNTVRVLRSTPLRYILPFNDAITVHKILGWLGFISSFGHTVAHAVDYVNQNRGSRKALWAAANPGVPQPDAGNTCSTDVVITGLIMWVVILIAYPFAITLPRGFTDSWRRISGALPFIPSLKVLANHNWFYATHHLFVVFYVALILHPKPAIPNEYHEWNVSDTWVWVTVPILIYVGERILRGYRHYFWRVRVLEVKPRLANVLEVKLSKPPGFKAVAGQYIMLRCPTVSLFEWHPFSLTSAPQDPFLMVHIQSAGDWSRAMYRHFEYGMTCANFDPFTFPQLILDGPFGAPAQDHTHFHTLLLVGGGIGLTPMVSVLKSLLAGHHADSPRSGDVEQARLDRRDRCVLYWCVRDEQQLAWCTEILQEILSKDAQGYLEVHVHVTGKSASFPEGSLPGHSITQPGSEIVLTKGRPVWPEVLESFTGDMNDRVRVGVFFCGPQPMADALRRVCRRMSTSGSRKFLFHQEHF